MTGIFATAGSGMTRVQRLLIPIRQRSERSLVHRLEARLVERLKRQGPLSVTLLNVSAPGEGAEGARFLERISATFPSVGLTCMVVEGVDPASAILAEAARGYQLLVLGATEGIEHQDVTFHPLTDEIVRLAPCPTIVVRGGTTVGHWPPHRLLVPAGDTVASRHAAELAYLLATREDEEVVILDSSPGPAEIVGSSAEDALVEHAIVPGHGTAGELIALGRARGARTRGVVEVGDEAEAAILTARREASDLIIVGADLLPGSERLYLGPRIEGILQKAPCPVIVVTWSAPGALLNTQVAADMVAGQID